MEILITAILAFFSAVLFYQNTEKTGHKISVGGGLTRPLTEMECDYMESLPLMGVVISASQEISPAHEPLLLMGLVEEVWDADGQSRRISFSDQGLVMARSMRTSN